MGILNWDKPKKLRSSQEHNKMHMSDSGVAGTYVPNMSEQDKLKWKAKHINGADPRVEIRKTIEGTQVLIVVKPEGGFTNSYKRYSKATVKISMNGPSYLSNEDLENLYQAIQEAKEVLAN